MTVGDRTRNAALVKEMKLSHESWKKGPYGFCWLDLGMRRQPSIEELHIIAKRNIDGKTTTEPTPK